MQEGSVPDGDTPKKGGLTKEQIAAVTKDIAAVTQGMQEQLQAISQEVAALKGQMNTGGLSEIQKELDALKDRTGSLDGAHRTGSGARRRPSVRSDTSFRPIRTAGDDAMGLGLLGAQATEPGTSRGRRPATEYESYGGDLARRINSPKEKRSIWPSKTTLTFVVVFLLIGPLRRVIMSYLYQGEREAEPLETEFDV